MHHLAYKYGLRAPTYNADLVAQQMFAGHRYRNDLTAIERGRRGAERNLMESDTTIQELEAVHVRATEEVSEARKAIKGARAATHKRTETDAMKEALRVAKEKQKSAQKALSEGRKASREATKNKRDAIGETANEIVRNARSHTEAYWGSYLLAEAALKQASKAPLYFKGEANDPGFRRWDGTGRIGVQLQGGLDATEAFASLDGKGDSRLRIEILHVKGTIGGKLTAYANLHVRVQSTEKGRPVWATFPIKMHRPFPEGAIIKGVTVQLRKIGPREEWTACFSLSLPEVGATTNEGVVTMDVGWRLLSGGSIRVAKWKGSDGTEGEIVLPAYEFVGGMARVDSLQQTRKVEFNAVIERFRSWLKSGVVTPDWIKKATTHIHLWESQARLGALVRRWKLNRFEGDSEIYTSMEAWRYHDYHLWQWMESQRSKTLGYRKDLYRNEAAKLARRYGVIVLEGEGDAAKAFDLRPLARRKDMAENETARSNRQLAAVSELRTAMQQGFVGRGGRVDYVPAAGTTKTCAAVLPDGSVCGHSNEFDAAESIEHTCTQCGTRWDQDENACNRMHVVYRERSSGVHTPGGARNGGNPSDPPSLLETKWQKIKRLRAEKEARMATARNGGDKAAE